jgi:hypothetical protein
MATYQLAKPEEGFADKFRTGSDKYKGASQGSNLTGGKTLFTATGAGTTTTIVGAAANLTTSLNCVRLGERCVLVNSAGVLKEPTVFTVTAHNGTTTATFTPAAAGATANGDRLVQVSSDPFADNDSLDAELLARGYSQAYVDRLTQNDKVYAARQFSLPEAVR